MAKKPAKRKALDLTLPIYQIKISLKDTEPLIWRRVLMNDCPLNELHDIIQIVMGWEELHMHAFEVRDKTFADPTMRIEDAYDSRDVRLSELASQGHLRFDYEYDFGDEWQHLVEIEKTLAAEPGVCYPRCVEGEQAGPPEDSGGSWRYDYLIEKYRDPEHEEHDEAMEWLGDNFDPDKLDLDAVNYQLGRFRKWLGRDPGTGVLQAVFAKGDLVRVKAGVTHPRYPDLPLGGWVGEVKKVVWLTPITYGIEWTSTTLNQVHPVYVKRCGRDKVIPSRSYVDEQHLEPVSSETPVVVEQPPSLVTRPLSTDAPDDCIRTVFGLTPDDALPKVDERAQRRFLDYLKDHLLFPFQAEYWPQLSAEREEALPAKALQPTVLGFADPPCSREKGVLCNAEVSESSLTVPLAGLEVASEHPNFRIIRAYTHWLWGPPIFSEDDGDCR